MPIIDEFLTGISSFLKTKDALQLQKFLRVEPPLPAQFMQLSKEMKTTYSNGDDLERYIAKLVPEAEDGKADEGGAWPGFLAFLKEYLEFWRDVNFEDLLETHTQLSNLANACITALSNSSYGIIVLPATIQLCSSLARLAMMLDKRPDLTSKVVRIADEGETRKTLVEGTAESIQRAFTMCLTERTTNRSGVGRNGIPEGKKVGIYSFANMVLRLLFQCRKTRLANQLFTNISQNSPPLTLYPASQRVTYLYYLGRYHFSNNHFYYAAQALQSAYDQCRTQDLKHRRHILIFLISANMILGRFPGPSFMSRPEASDLLKRFAPVAKAIRRGNMITFKQALGPEGGNEQWFFQQQVLLPLRSRCEVLVWRSFARQVFLLTYQFPSDPNSRKAPTLDLGDFVAAAQFCQKIMEGWARPVDPAMQGGRPMHPNNMFMKVPDLAPPPGGPKKLPPQQGMVFGNMTPDLKEIEAIVASLVQQDLLHGFISHNQAKFAIIGAKQRGGPLNAGFPPVWETLKARAEKEGRAAEVPGWVQTERKFQLGGVVEIQNARPVGDAE